jgi:hypothetical protein
MSGGGAFVRDPDAVGLDSMMSVTGAKLHTYRWLPPADKQLVYGFFHVFFVSF